MYATMSKEKPDPCGRRGRGFDAARKLTDKPLVAIGGITLKNAGEVLAAGADSVAVISGLLPIHRICGFSARESTNGLAQSDRNGGKVLTLRSLCYLRC